MISLKDKRFFFRQITLTINLIWLHAFIHSGFVSKSPTNEKIPAYFLKLMFLVLWEIWNVLDVNNWVFRNWIQNFLINEVCLWYACFCSPWSYFKFHITVAVNSLFTAVGAVSDKAQCTLYHLRRQIVKYNACKWIKPFIDCKEYALQVRQKY